MKKVIASITVLCYLAVSCGVIVNFHYCMNQLDSTKLFATKSETCGKCGMHTDDSNGCCRDEVKIVKMQIDQKTVDSAFQPAQFGEIGIPASVIEITSHTFPSVTEENPISHAPPRSSGIAVYIRNCVFLI